MPKMSPEQKAANKAASQAHSKAFQARKKVYNQEVEAADAAAAARPEHAASEAARAGLDQAMAQRAVALRDIDEEIARLQARRKEVDKQHGLAVEVAREHRDATWSASQAVVKALKQEVEERYPDMVGVWYASGWQRPEGV
jgi:chromosome segregation ATPase